MTRHSAATALALVLTVIAAASGCSGDSPPGRHVVLILLDAARPDRLGSYDPGRTASPHLDALAKRGTVFLEHFSQATDTRSSLPQLLYSRYFIQPLFPLSAKVPFSHPSDLFRRLDDEAISLPSALAADGFHTAMISAHTWLKPETPFAEEFDEAHDLSSVLDLELEFPHPRAEAVIDFTLDWLDRNRARDVFLYLHLMDTHSPRFFDDDAAAMLDDPDEARRWMGTRDRELRTGDTVGPTERRVLDAIYDGSVRYTDRHLGRLFDRYRDWGVLDRTLIAVTADHGELLLERPGRLGHGGPWYEPVARVPLIVSYPVRVAPRRVTAESETVDLVPTLLGLLEIAPSAGKSLDGTDLLAEEGSPPSAPTVGHRALRVDGFKVLFDQPDDMLLARDAPEAADLSGELYDLDSDPGETENLWSRRPDVVAAALAGYRQHLGRQYARYRRTRTERQPASSFAIAARHFRTDRPIPTVASRRTAAEGGWVLSDHWQESYLMALPGAEPLTVEFELPNGAYELSVATSGDCRLEVPGGGAASPEIEIRDRIFKATVAPEPGGSPCSISYFGFRPAGARDDDPERDERLRALGYVN